jgi:hypothetical protein
MSNTTWEVRFARTLLDIIGLGVIYQIRYQKDSKKILKIIPILQQMTYERDVWNRFNT